MTVIGCADAARSPTPEPRPTATGAANAHLGSLAIDPADGTLFLGTALGLYRYEAGAPAAVRISGKLERGGASGTVSRLLVIRFARAGELLASGHPEPGGSLPEELGLIRSVDAGRTWQPISRLGEADFHVLQVAGDRVVAVGAEETEVEVSTDAGRTFDVRPLPGVVVDLAFDPSDPARMVLSTERGLFTSPDAGHGWRPRETTASGSQLAWAARDALYRADADRSIRVSRDGGQSWERRGATRAAATELATDARGSLYAALPGAQVHRSDDGGASWQPVAQLR